MEGKRLSVENKERGAASLPLAYSTPERLAQDFTCRGLVVLAPESLGIPAEVHGRIYAEALSGVEVR